MIFTALLSAIHMLTLALGLGGIVARGRALASPLDEAGWRRLLAADNAWGAAAALWIALDSAGCSSGKGDRLLLAQRFLLDEARALRTRVCAGAGADADVHPRARRAAPRCVLPNFSAAMYRRINTAEMGLVVAIVFVAAFMARGAWLF